MDGRVLMWIGSAISGSFDLGVRGQLAGRPGTRERVSQHGQIRAAAKADAGGWRVDDTYLRLS